MSATAEIFPGYRPRPADLMFTTGDLIPRFEQAPGEDYSWAAHAGGTISTDPAYVVHSLARVRTDSLEKVRASYDNVEFWRLEPLSMEVRKEIARWVADRYSGRFYPAWRLLLHGFDWALAWGLFYATGRTGEIYAARKLIPKKTRLGLCHRIWAEAYKAVLGYEFGLPPRFVNPDALRDHIVNHQGHPGWVRVYPPLVSA